MFMLIKQIFVFILIGFIALFLFFYIFQRKMIYLPDKRRPASILARQYGFKEVKLETKDGLKLLSWYKAAERGKLTVLYFHGNAGNISYRLPLARQVLNAGYGLFLLGYRGYGGNPGSPNEKANYKDARKALAYLHAQGVKTESIVLYGESLGTGIAVELAQAEPYCAVVLQSPFTSLPDLARWHYPWTFLKPWDRYNSLAKIEKVQAPLLIVHGKRDRIVPFAQARKLEAKAQTSKQFLSYPNRGHLDLWQSDYYAELIKFIHAHCVRT